MIIQKHIIGQHEIRIENAESMEDAKENNFPEGVYYRVLIDNKFVQNYHAVIRFIQEEVQKNRNTIIPNNSSLMQKRQELLEKNNIELKNEMDKIQSIYGKNPIAGKMIDNLNSVFGKVNEMGVRIVE